ncbi:hypothetical protein BOTBODRAFT_179609 [Botryobasidium botryosum FD-172 SS1]|uniref:Uncharacterized protein n=1 Tax=Botryobasidium botryosum (strain FD-172 SS1) TaxID=930990 RepID=A0A067M1T9_BOTB1|nr:hypothetical protein BOTBODRAFT_179609 [Botryobasidium botryosum FD-172 SS1]
MDPTSPPQTPQGRDAASAREASRNQHRRARTLSSPPHLQLPNANINTGPRLPMLFGGQPPATQPAPSHVQPSQRPSSASQPVLPLMTLSQLPPPLPSLSPYDGVEQVRLLREHAEQA